MQASNWQNIFRIKGATSTNYQMIFLLDDCIQKYFYFNKSMFRKIIILLLLAFNGFAQEVPNLPNPPRLVNDFVGGLLSPTQINALEQKLIAYNDSTSSQITIVIVKSVEPYDMFSYAQALFRKWKIGQAGKDNGILLLWAPGDRKIRIHTGYGMEGAITDARSKRIISQIISPYFKELKYYDGLNKATDQLAVYAAGEHKAEPRSDTGEGDFMTIILLFFLFMFIVWIFSRNNNNRGGGNRRTYHDSGWPYWTYSSGGGSSGSWGGGGFGGGFGGGGGGGFGGFGGGDSGGGGASGDY
jgi:uncharacterized protein